MASEKKDLKVALREVAQMIRNSNIPGLVRPKELESRIDQPIGGYGTVAAEFRIAFGCAATLTAEFDADFEHDGVPVPKVRLSWPSVNMDLNDAQSSIALYQQVSQLAYLIQAKLRDEKYERPKSSK